MTLFARFAPTVTSMRLYCGCLGFLAGATGLTAQIVWLRKFGHVFGSTVQAASISVALTLAGLALGAYFIGRLADRSTKPLHLAAWLLILAGLAITAGLAVFAAADVLSYEVVAATSTAPIQWLLRLILAAVVLLPPTTLLGGVLPALVRAASSSANSAKTEFGLIYGLETAGGAVGGLLTGFILIRAFGLNGTLLLASLASATALVTFLVARGATALAANGQSDSTDRDRLPTSTASARSWCHIAVAVAGFASLGMEILWTRLLLLVLGGDSFAYTTVVTTYLLGLALGALLARRVVSLTSHPLRLFAWFQIGVAASSLVLLVVFSQVAAGPGQQWLAAWGDGWGAVIGGRFGFFFGLLLVPTVFIGLSVPTLAAYLLHGCRDTGKRAGRFYAANTAGNVAGALAAGFVLLPLLGIQSSFVVLAGLNLAAAVVAVIAASGLRAARGESRGGIWAKRTQLALIVLGLMVCSSWRWIAPFGPLGIDAQSLDEYRVAYYREGPVATVLVLENRRQADHRVMAVNGVIIGESQGGVDEKQRMLAHFPFLVRPHAAKKNILTIGLGTGILAGELVAQADVEQVVCLELSPAVIEAARKFDDLNGNIQEHPNVMIVATDGIQYLRQRSMQYDAIISDAKSRPGHAGNVSFFSRDYYELCQSRLTKDGVFVQWVSLETPNRALQIIMRTFVESFPHSAVGIAAPDSLYLIGAATPLELDVAKIQHHLESPGASGLRRYEWRHACDILALLVADATTFADATNGIPVNTIDRPHLEFEAGEVFKTSAANRKYDNLRFLLSALENASGIQSIACGETRLATNCRQSMRLMLEANALEAAQEQAWFETAAMKYQQALDLAPDHNRMRVAAARMHVSLARESDQHNDIPNAVNHYEQALEFRPELVEPRKRIAQLARQAGDLRRAALAHLGLGVVYRSKGETDLAKQHFRLATELDPALQEQIIRLGVSDL